MVIDRHRDGANGMIYQKYSKRSLEPSTHRVSVDIAGACAASLARVLSTPHHANPRFVTITDHTTIHISTRSDDPFPLNRSMTRTVAAATSFARSRFGV